MCVWPGEGATIVQQGLWHFARAWLERTTSFDVEAFNREIQLHPWTLATCKQETARVDYYYQVLVEG